MSDNNNNKYCFLCNTEDPVGGLTKYTDDIPFTKPPEIYHLCKLCERGMVRYINKHWNCDRTIVASVNAALNVVRKEIRAYGRTTNNR